MDKFILADVTEGRYLPAPLQELCYFIAGIEEMTGADFIISPLDIPHKSEALIRRHASMGLCVQRKDIGDFAASLRPEDNRLWNQLLRMRQICQMPWLLIIGDLKCDKEGHAVIDGRNTDWNYTSLLGAMDWWQRRGGFMSWISRDSLMVDWCHLQYNVLVEREKAGGEWQEHGVVRPIPQTLYSIPDVQRTLLTFPGIGSDRAEAIYKKAVEKVASKPTLMDVMIVIQDEEVEGVGKVTREKALRHIGWANIENETR
jgi:hypothetical protein